MYKTLKLLQSLYVNSYSCTKHFSSSFLLQLYDTFLYIFIPHFYFYCFVDIACMFNVCSMFVIATGCLNFFRDQ